MKFLSILAMAAFLAAPALADDLFPPDWRGDPNTTFQHWTFSYPQGDPSGYPMGPWLPEYSNNPYGQPAIQTYYHDEQWFDVYQGRQGVVDPWANNVYISLPNVPEPNDWKYVYFQITYWPLDDNGTPTAPMGLYTDPAAANQYMINQLTLPDGWIYESWQFEIPGNPPFETLGFMTGNDLYIDQIVVDTLCIPEPASMLLIAIAGLFLRRR